MTFSKKVLPVIISALFISSPQFSYAEDNQQIELEEVGVTSIIDSRILNHPAAVETYTKQQIQDTINATTSQPMFTVTPSVGVRIVAKGKRLPTTTLTVVVAVRL